MIACEDMANNEERPASQSEGSQRFKVVFRVKTTDPPVTSLFESSDEERDNSDQPIPSNQMAVESHDGTLPMGSNYHPPAQIVEEEEDKGDWSFFTQYIGPSPTTSRKNRDNTSTVVEDKITNFRSKYLQQTEMLDKAKAHLTALKSAEARGKTPAGMSITMKPMILEREDPHFKSAWAMVINSAKKTRWPQFILCVCYF